MKLLHILVGGTMGGIEQLCFDIANYDHINNSFLVLKSYKPLLNKIAPIGSNIKVFFGEENLSVFKIKKVSDYICGLYSNGFVDAVVIHHPCIFTFNLAIAIKKIIPKLSVNIYIHADIDDVLMKNSKKYYIHRYLFGKCSKSANNIIVISEFVKKSVLNYYPSVTNKMTVNYNGIDLSHFIVNKDKKNEQMRLLYVGRIIKEKGIQNTIRLLVKCKNLNFHFDIVGEGQYMNELKNLVKTLQLDEYISFLGRKENVYQFINNYDVFIHLPEWDEGFGITIIEALASGLICIVNEKGALPEIIRNGYNGIILNNNDLSNVLKDVYEGRYDRLRLNAVESASLFSIKKTYDNLVRIIR